MLVTQTKCLHKIAARRPHAWFAFVLVQNNFLESLPNFTSKAKKFIWEDLMGFGGHPHSLGFMFVIFVCDLYPQTLLREVQTRQVSWREFYACLSSWEQSGNLDYANIIKTSFSTNPFSTGNTASCFPMLLRAVFVICRLCNKLLVVRVLWFCVINCAGAKGSNRTDKSSGTAFT